MLAKQISVFLENKPGQLANFIQMLAAHHIDLQALSLAEAQEYGLVRIVVDKPEDTVALLKEQNWPCALTEVLSVLVPDKPGSLTAIVGETGVGKSTLVKLILALSEPEEGSICFYNATTEFEASPLTRCNLSYVPQGNTLMSGTIRDNLLMGNPHADEDEMDAALYAAAADFVFALPDGLDTYCGEQGAGISEGQAQRIAIARGLLRPGGVLLLDEPSSSLDGETEQILLQRLSERLQDKTLLLITHRETIAQLCTSVVRMESKI